MSTVGYINVALETFGGLLSLIFILCLRITRFQRDNLDRAYIRLLTCNTLLLFCDAAAWLFRRRPDRISFYAVRITNFLVYVLGYMILVLFTHYLICYFREKGVNVGLTYLYIMCGIAAAASVFVVISQFNHMYYRIDERNIYIRQGWFWLSQAFGIAGLVLNGRLLICNRKHLGRLEKSAFGIYIILPVGALLFQILFYSIAVLYLATTVCLMCIYISIQMELSRELSRKELELEKSRVSLMLSQIQPHFLYNSLVAIMQLCEDEPKKATGALEHFAFYLRGNLYSISDPKLISFEQELGHVKNYLYLEQLRFGDRVIVQWEVEFTEFRLPPLTLQPLVENAVCHGITRQERGGTLLIGSRLEGDGVLLTVEDDGVGFDKDVPQDNSRPHIGIENVKNRIAVQCQGSLQIESEPGRGTKVILYLPLKTAGCVKTNI